MDTTLVMSFKDTVDGDRLMSVYDICDVTGHSYGTVQRVLNEELNIRLLTDDHRRNRVTASRKFLHRYRREGTDFLDRIVTPDEVWIYLYDLEIKEHLRKDVDSSYAT